MHRPNNRLLWSVAVTSLLVLAVVPLAHAEYLGNITFDTAQSSFLPHDQRVFVSIDYKIDEPAGRRIYDIPYTEGAPSPGYGVSGSDVVPAGTGPVTRFFTITGGDVVVDAVRVYTRDPDFTETPLEIFVPAAYQFGAHGVWNIQPSTTPHSMLKHGMNLSVQMDYAVDAASCRIFARPWNGSHQPSGYSASGSALLPSSGSHSQYFSFAADADISHIHIYINDGTSGERLADFFYPFPASWREWGVYDISFNHDDLTSLHNSQQLVSTFTYDHDVSDGLRIWTWLIQDGDYCPGSGYQGSVLEPAGPHTVSRYALVLNGTEEVDAVRFLVGSTEEFYTTFDVPLHVTYGPHAIQNVQFSPASPAIFSYDERLEMTYDYITDEAAGVRIYGRAAFDGAGLFGMTSAGSPLYPAPSGSGDFWMSYDVNTTADAIRFQMVSEDQSVTFLEWFEPGYFVWGSSGTVTAVEDLPVASALGQGYPNPFNPTATVPVTLARTEPVRLDVYDLRGRLVRTLHDGTLAAGHHDFTFDGTGLGSGTYLFRLQTPRGDETRRLMLVK